MEQLTVPDDKHLARTRQHPKNSVYHVTRIDGREERGVWSPSWFKLPLMSCVTLGKSISLTVLQLSCL